MPKEETPKIQDESLATLNLTAKILSQNGLKFETIRIAQCDDPQVYQLIQQLPNGYKIHQGILIKVGRSADKIVIPQGLVEPLLFTFHRTEYGNHIPKDSMYKNINEYFYHKDLKQNFQG